MWAGDRLRSLRTSGWVGRRLPYLFGGPHISHPSPSTAGVEPGDRIYPLVHTGGRLMVLCECVAGEVMPIERFVERERVPYRLTWQSEYLRDWLAERRCAWLAPTCTDDAVVVKAGTPVAVNRLIPLEEMAGVRMQNAKGERPLSNLLPDGRLKNATTIHGRYYRAAARTAALLAAVARGEM
jgi:hypothetical protein